MRAPNPSEPREMEFPKKKQKITVVSQSYCLPIASGDEGDFFFENSISQKKKHLASEPEDIYYRYIYIYIYIHIDIDIL